MALQLAAQACGARPTRRNLSHSHCARSISRQRTTPWIAGIGPASTTASRSAALLGVEPSSAWPGAFRVVRPATPSALKLQHPVRARSAASHRQPSPPASGSRRPRSPPAPKEAKPAARPSSSAQTCVVGLNSKSHRSGTGMANLLMRHVKSDPRLFRIPPPSRASRTGISQDQRRCRRLARRCATAATPAFRCKADLGAAGRARRPLSNAADCGTDLPAGGPRMLASASTMA